VDLAFRDDFAIAVGFIPRAGQSPRRRAALRGASLSSARFAFRVGAASDWLGNNFVCRGPAATNQTVKTAVLLLCIKE
jgi:hypothetical protein